MDEPTLLIANYVEAYHGIRGWGPRRMYVTNWEYYDILKSVPIHMYILPLGVGGITYMGCHLRATPNKNKAVVAKIRAWDMAPWPC